MSDNKVGTYKFVAEPFHCDFTGKLTMSVLGNHLLNCAGFHAADRGFGIATLNENHYTWVLSRLAIELEEMPCEYESFSIQTWVENVYRLFTDRNFAILDHEGNAVGYARSVWAMISMETRKPADLLTLHGGSITDYVCDKDCPISKPGRIKVTEKTPLVEYRTKYSDIDINGHVNSIKYIEHILDLFPIEVFKEKRVKRFEMAYVAESYYGDTLSFYREEVGEGEYDIEVRKNGTLKYLRPDGKTQVTVEYDENDKPVRLDAVVLSTQHDENVSQEQIHEDIKKYVFDEIIPADMVDENTKFFINPTGRFVIGGPHGDSGLTGRKIIVDTYGGYARHGGGAFSGKDCTKVDRSAAYAARYVAKNIVAAGLADKCEIQLSYAIGVAHPTSIMVDTFGTGKVSNEKLVEIIRENFDLRPAGIIKMLDLRRPIYKQTAAYGHFGRHDVDLPWEKLDRVEDLKKYL